MLELMFTKKGTITVGAIIDGGCGHWRPADYTKAYARFASAVGVRKPDFVSMATLYGAQCRTGVYWTESLGMRGCSFDIYQLPGVPDSATEGVRAWLRCNRDAVRVLKHKIDKLVEFNYGEPNIDTKRIQKFESAAHQEAEQTR
jgi:hypothetical protein